MNVRLKKSNREFRTRRLIFVAVVLLSTFAGQVDAGQEIPSALASSRRAQDDAQVKDVETLVAELDSPEFATRQEAAEQLWTMGLPIRNELAVMGEKSSPQVRRRVQSIVDLLDLGLDTDTRPELARVILSFVDRDQSGRQVRTGVLQKLVQENEWELYFELLERVEDPREADVLFSSTCGLYVNLGKLARLSSWDQLELLINHPMTRRADPKLKMYADLIDENFEEETQALKQIVEQEIQRVGPPTGGEVSIPRNPTELRRNPFFGGPPQANFIDREGWSEERLAEDNLRYLLDGKILELIARLRFLDRRDEAFVFTENLSNRDLGFELKSQMLMEQDKWKELIGLVKISDRTPKELAESETGQSEDGLDPVPDQQKGKQKEDLPHVLYRSLNQKGLMQYFADDKEGMQATLEQLKKRVAEENKLADDNTDFRQARSSLMSLLLAQGDWDQARKYMEKEEDQETWFSLLVAMHRYEEAFELVGLTDDVNQRFDWVNENLNKIKSVLKKSTGGRAAQQFDYEANGLFRLSLRVANQLESLGLTEEASTYAKLLSAITAAFSDPQAARRKQVLFLLMDLHEYDDVLRIIKTQFRGNDFNYLFTRLSPIVTYKEASAKFWFSYSGLERKYTDPFERLRIVCGIVNSPLAKEGFDVDQWLESLDVQMLSETPHGRSGNAQFQIAKVMSFHGRNDLYLDYLRRAMEKGLVEATRMLASELMRKGKYREASELYDVYWMQTGQSFEIMMAAEAYEKLGDRRAARNRRLACYNNEWQSSLRSEVSMGRFLEGSQKKHVADMIAICLYGPSRMLAANESYRRLLALANADSDPQAASIHWKIDGLNRMPAMDQPGDAIELFQNQSIAEFKARIIEKDLPAARKCLQRLVEFRPGDPDVGESCLALMDEMGARQQADDLFEVVSAFYFQTLAKYPDSPLHHNNYAWLCATSGRQIEFSRRHAERAVELRPNNSSYLDTLAEICFQQGDRQRATELVNRCLEINPTKAHYQRQAAKFSGSEK